jgi:hypothetical protein
LIASSSPSPNNSTFTGFSCEAADSRLHYLFVDEAGQVSVANLVAMAPCAENIVLLGDQMQLGQPIQGSQAEYQRNLDRQIAASAAVRRNDDGEIVEGVVRAWHTGLPSAPATFPSQASLH